VTSERWNEVKEVFASALERTDAERAEYLDRVCSNDETLRREVESLLASHQEAGGFIESPAISTDTILPGEEDEDPEIGRRIGAYRTVKEIGRGGMGSVYLAVRADEEFERRVAIKLIRRGMEIDFIVRRFRNERQILANLDHPYIARLLDGGTTEDGMPYFVMEYVDGQPIHRYCEAQNLPVSDRLRLFRRVCSAVQYAHQQQVIHRDLKPGNILVTADGMPKLLDFGIAKLLDPDVAPHAAEPTTLGFRMMTPAYASPEQLRGEPATTASDVYSLGVLLGELVTGRRPERSGAGVRTQAVLAGGLESVIAKAMREEPAERYASVEQLTEDVRGYADGQPVSAPASAPPVAQPADETKTIAGPRSIAILPFRSIAPEERSDEYLGVGIADALITRLSNIRRITVRPTSSVLRYARSEYDLLAAARELEVQYVLDGSMRRSGDRVRITVQLVRTRDSAPLWASKFDEKFTDILNLEDSLSENLAQALIERLTADERGLLRKRGTDNPDAYQAYLKGRYYWSQLTEEGLAKALLSFSEALALDPTFALAQAGLADYYNWLAIWSVLPPTECFAAARDAALKALDLDPALAEAHAALAFLTWNHEHDFEAAARGFQRAIELNPDYALAHQWYAYLLSTQRRHEEALASMERAARLDPLSPMTAVVAAFLYYMARRPDRAMEEAQRALRLDSQHFMVHDIFAWVYSQKGLHSDAVKAAEKALTLAPRDPVALWTAALALGGAGRLTEARDYLRQMLELAQARYLSSYYVAVIHAVLGDTESAVEWLEKSFENRDSWFLWMAVEPRLDKLRGNPRFRNLEQRTGRHGTDREGTPAQPIVTSPPVAGSRPAGPSTARRRRIALWEYAAVIGLGLILVAVIGTLLSRSAPPFENIKIIKLGTNGNAASAAISPDGRYISYTLDRGRGMTIWIRQVAVSASRPIVPPADAFYRGLTFSADGAYLYYVLYDRNDFLHGALYRVPSLGGPQRKLIGDVESPVGLAPDGKRAAFIRANPGNAQGDLVVASLDGQGERKLASLQHPERFAQASAPAWSPDGDLIAAAIEKSDAQGQYVDLVTIRIKDGEQKPLQSQRWQFVERMAWLPSGAALMLIGQNAESTFQQIWAVPERGGKPIQVTNDLNDYIGISVTADSRQVATVQFQVLANIWMPPKGNGSSARQITYGAGRYYDLAWTPDGRILCSSDASDAVDIWSREADGSSPKQLTSAGRRNYGAAASPDGKYIVFHTNRTGTWNIWRMEADGANPEPLTKENRTESTWPQVSRDGRSVIFHRPAPGGAVHSWKVPIDGGEPMELTQETCMRPAVSPRDGAIACWYCRDATKPHWQIAVFGPDGGQPEKVFDLPKGVSIDSTLHWSPDSSAIHYVNNRDSVSNIWSQPLDGSPPRPITNFTTGQIYSFAWSRDGAMALSRGMQTSEVVLISQAQ
jgi:serine/threonine protein kinase/Tol biopolymer transport system component/tetratricopeptide (TPR) repeat protein